MSSDRTDEDCPPDSEVLLRSIAMPADTNPAGDIFGGWLLSQMDTAGGVLAHQRAGGRVTTIAIEAMKFHRPVLVGDLVTCYGSVHRIGRTSLAIKIETWSRRSGGEVSKVTEGVFTYVALDEHRRKRVIGGS